MLKSILLLIAIGLTTSKHAANPDGKSPVLSWAHQRAEIPHALEYDYDYDHDYDYDYDLTEAHLAAQSGDLAKIKELKESGADFNAVSGLGLTPVHLAISEQHAEVIFALKAAGASLDVQDKRGNTPLHLASYFGYEAGLNALLDLGANLSIENADGLLPINIAFNQEDIPTWNRLSIEKVKRESKNKLLERSDL